MPPTTPEPAPPGRSANVRVVAVDESSQPQYLVRARALEQALLEAATSFGLDAEDLPGLHGMCVEAVRSAERHGR
jgi:hypothetical protein